VSVAINGGSWSDPTIWDTGSVPGLSDDVDLAGYSVTLDIDADCASLTDSVGTSVLDCPSGTVTLTSVITSNVLASNALITVEGTLILGDGTILDPPVGSTAAIIFVGDSGSLSFEGTVTPDPDGTGIQCIVIFGGATFIGSPSPVVGVIIGG